MDVAVEIAALVHELNCSDQVFDYGVDGGVDL